MPVQRDAFFVRKMYKVVYFAKPRILCLNRRIPLLNQYRHAPACDFGAPARCRALREGASILVQRRNRPRLRVFADYVAFKTRQGRLSAPLGRALKEVESEQPRDQAICCWQEAGRLAGGLRTQHNRQKPVETAPSATPAALATRLPATPATRAYPPARCGGNLAVRFGLRQANEPNAVHAPKPDASANRARTSRAPLQAFRRAPRPEALY